MNFVKLGEQYINLDTISSITPKNGFGYIAWIIGGSSMEISEEQMATIKTVLKQKDAINEINAFASRNPSKEEIFERLKKLLQKENDSSQTTKEQTMNNHKGYTYQKLNDGRILAEMPTVGNIIFENEEEFKAYIDGYLITQKFFGEIEKELRNAVTKHPKFCDNFTEDKSGMIWQTREECAKTRNAKMEPTADSILFEEIAEAFNAYQHGDKKQALKELAQVGAVVFRCMEYVQKEVEAGT